MFTDFGRIITAAVTPFDTDGAVDEATFRRLLDHLADNGSDAVVVAGTTGESATLSDDEKVRLFEIAVEHLGGRIPVIAGTGGNDTQHTVHLTQRACAAGVDGVLVVTPYYNKPPRAGLVAHFTAVSRASSVPIILYNIPSRVVIDMAPDLIAELAQLENVVALKEANPDLERIARVRELAPDLTLYAGNDDLLYDTLRLGGVGGICVASHVVGPQMQEITRLWNAGDQDGARAEHERLLGLYDALAVTANPIPLKAALAEIGLPVGGLRLPLVEATQRERAIVRDALTSINVPHLV